MLTSDQIGDVVSLYYTIHVFVCGAVCACGFNGNGPPGKMMEMINCKVRDWACAPVEIAPRRRR